tara:strand:- start:6749 stop:7480 length:732 start_codon:yes stop_codon:yes gene_type:complete
MKKFFLGSWITIDNVSVVEVMASSGFDWLCVDLEHTVIDYKELQLMISTINSCKLKSYVRVSSNDETCIKRSLDCGADGIIVPQIKNLDDAKLAINHTFYRPIGKRGVSAAARAQNYGFGFKEYQEKSKSIKLILQIEHIEAINNLEDILKLKEISGTFIGPYDLSASLGSPGDFNNIKVKKALKKFKDLNKNSNKLVGYHVIEPDAKKVKEKVKEGYSFIAFSWDMYFLGSICRENIKKLKV